MYNKFNTFYRLHIMMTVLYSKENSKQCSTKRNLSTNFTKSIKFKKKMQQNLLNKTQTLVAN